MLGRLCIVLILTLPVNCWVLLPSKILRSSQHIRKAGTKCLSSEIYGLNVTSVILLVGYDGGRFTGWSAANDGSNQSGFVRSVEGVLRTNLSKIFGNVDPARVVIEGTSRTDKGVHACGMVAQAYCLTQDWNTTQTVSFLPGKRLPHPLNSIDDSCFVPFRKSPKSLITILNRMLPNDVSILGISPSPSSYGRPFHPTLDAKNKTYVYRFSVGPIPDPNQWRRTWHIGETFEPSYLEPACEILKGTHNFQAFRGSPRGKGDRQRQLEESTICTLYDLSLEIERGSCPIPGLSTYHLRITGDRFLYKMVRFLVGSLAALGQGTLFQHDLVRAIETGSFDPQQKPPCAPGKGLLLLHVGFESEIEWIC